MHDSLQECQYSSTCSMNNWQAFCSLVVIFPAAMQQASSLTVLVIHSWSRETICSRNARAIPSLTSLSSPVVLTSKCLHREKHVWTPVDSFHSSSVLCTSIVEGALLTCTLEACMPCATSKFNQSSYTKTNKTYRQSEQHFRHWLCVRQTGN